MAEISDHDFLKHNARPLRVDKAGRVYLPKDWQAQLGAEGGGVDIIAYFDERLGRVVMANRAEARELLRQALGGTKKPRRKRK